MRAFYESLLEQKPNSLMALKYCIENGCLDQEKVLYYKYNNLNLLLSLP